MLRHAMIVALVMLFATQGSALAATSEELCASAKMRAAGKLSDGLLKCFAKSAKEEGAAQQTCMDKTGQKFDAAFAKAEAKYTCATPGDGSAVAALVIAGVNAVALQAWVKPCIISIVGKNPDGTVTLSCDDDPNEPIDCPMIIPGTSCAFLTIGHVNVCGCF